MGFKHSSGAGTPEATVTTSSTVDGLGQENNQPHMHFLPLGPLYIPL